MKVSVFQQSRQRWSYCGNRVALCSSGTAAMTSTSFGALAKQYLREACSQGEACVEPVSLCQSLHSGRLLTSRFTLFKSTSLPSLTPATSSPTISAMALTRAYKTKGLFDRVQETAAELLACSGTNGDAMQPGSVTVPLLVEAQPSPSCFCVTCQNRRRHLGSAHLAGQPLRGLTIESQPTAQLINVVAGRAILRTSAGSSDVG